eukprot:CAMPEP_0173271028 /NCGR_PEP_ID=MMETSP1143-20121109/581_1 /TAXON_ID=483371 /ORGANISM="non described non described, Strain CCMP2298" /LENGTH=174 /DNA_ID=CAMNT_0014207531 /DNA_START=169 /DNA_END=691 /DNA_ORIENTATION=-
MAAPQVEDAGPHQRALAAHYYGHVLQQAEGRHGVVREAAKSEAVAVRREAEVKLVLGEPQIGTSHLVHQCAQCECVDLGNVLGDHAHELGVRHRIHDRGVVRSVLEYDALAQLRHSAVKQTSPLVQAKVVVVEGMVRNWAENTLHLRKSVFTLCTGSLACSSSLATLCSAASTR